MTGAVHVIEIEDMALKRGRRSDEERARTVEGVEVLNLFAEYRNDIASEYL